MRIGEVRLRMKRIGEVRIVVKRLVEERVGDEKRE